MITNREGSDMYEPTARQLKAGSQYEVGASFSFVPSVPFRSLCQHRMTVFTM